MSGDLRGDIGGTATPVDGSASDSTDCQDDAEGSSKVEILRPGGSTVLFGVAVICVATAVPVSCLPSIRLCSSVDVRGLLIIDFRGFTFSEVGAGCADGPA